MYLKRPKKVSKSERKNISIKNPLPLLAHPLVGINNIHIIDNKKIYINKKNSQKGMKQDRHTFLPGPRHLAQLVALLEYQPLFN